jgi:hypothetical protein
MVEQIVRIHTFIYLFFCSMDIMNALKKIFQVSMTFNPPGLKTLISTPADLNNIPMSTKKTFHPNV